MTILSQTKLLTAEEFARLPQPEDGSQQELVDGVIVTMPPPSFLHGVVCNRIGRKVGNFVEENRLGFVTNNDSGVLISRDPDTVRGPDIAYWSRERLPNPPREGYPDVAPDLVVEVLSPHDVFSKVTLKAEQYLKSGVRLVWIVVPEDRAVTELDSHRKMTTLTEKDNLTGGEVLPGFICPVAQLFG